MSKTKIDWADYTWNPITGCYHGCLYCYAKIIANRFGNKAILNTAKYEKLTNNGYQIVKQFDNMRDDNGNVTPYAFGFKPTFYANRLTYPSEIKKPSNIFVGSMADIFGRWVPDEWIKDIFDACDKYPLHNYLFLTKNPERYSELIQKGLLLKKNNMWYGTTITKQDDKYFKMDGYNTFISFEPLMERIHNSLDINNEGMADWIIIGAETGNRKDKVKVTQDMVIETMISAIHYDNDPRLQTPVFMKQSLIDIVEPKYFTQRFPKSMMKHLYEKNYLDIVSQIKEILLSEFELTKDEALNWIESSSFENIFYLNPEMCMHNSIEEWARNIAAYNGRWL